MIFLDSAVCVLAGIITFTIAIGFVVGLIGWWTAPIREDIDGGGN